MQRRTDRAFKENPKALRVLGVPVALGLHPDELVEPLARERTLEPVQELRGRIHLVVVLAFGEHRHFVEVFGEPGGVFGYVDKAVVDHPGLVRADA